LESNIARHCDAILREFSAEFKLNSRMQKLYAVIIRIIDDQTIDQFAFSVLASATKIDHAQA